MSRRGRGSDRDRPYMSGHRFEERERRTGWDVAPPSKTLWVGSLSPHVTKNDLYEHFLRFGDVEDISHLPGRNYAFVNFRREEDAVIALRGLQGFVLAGNPIRIEFAKGDKAPPVLHDDNYLQHGDDRYYAEKEEPYFRSNMRSQRQSPQKLERAKGNKNTEPCEVLWIGFPASLNVEEASLRRAFSPFGEIEKISTFPGRSFAFVRYRSVVSACRAKEALNGKLFHNPRVHICFAKNECASGDKGREYDNPFTSHINPDFEPDLSGQNREPFLRERSFERPPLRGFPSQSPGFATNSDMLLGDSGYMGNGRDKFARPGAGSGTSSVGFEQNRLQELERKMLNDPYESYRNSPISERNLKWRNIPIERPRRTPPFEDSQGLEDRSFPLAKKLKQDFIPDKELPEYPFFDLEHQKLKSVPPKHFPNLADNNNNINNNNFSSSFGQKGVPDHLQNPDRIFAESDEPWRRSDNFIAGASPLVANMVKPQRMNPESRQLPRNEVWKWEGIVAKGGSTVCRARCFPVGKVLDFMLPEVLDCTSRTSLDTLSKHYYQAACSWVVFFVPESDADIGFYNEFLHYLEEKQRAAVVKLGEKVTLFLVPPSEFSAKVLKVPGKMSISGVILKFQQPSSEFNLPQNQLEVREHNLPPHDLVRHDGETSFAKANSPDFAALSQGQTHFSSPSGLLPAGTSNFPQYHPGDHPSFSGSFHHAENFPDQMRRPEQLRPQTLPSQPNWSNQMKAPSSTVGTLPPPPPGPPQLVNNFNTAVNPGVVPGSSLNPNAPVTSSLVSFPPLLPPPQQASQPQAPSTATLQPEQFAQLAALLDQQKHHGKEPSVPTDMENRKANLLQNSVLQAQGAAVHTSDATVLMKPSLSHPYDSAPFVSSGQLSQTQQYQQQLSSSSMVQYTDNPGQQSNPQTANSKRDDGDADPQQRLQATLQLAAALLQQIQQQSKTTN